MKGIFIIWLIFIGINVYSQAAFVVPKGSASAITPDSVFIQFDTTIANHVTLAGYSMAYSDGDPSLNVISGTIPGTTITWTTVATSNWGQFGVPPNCILPNNGMSSATVPAGATNAMKEGYTNTTTYQTTNAQVIIGGLNPAFTYDISVYCSANTTPIVAAVTNVSIRGLTLLTPQNINASGNTSTALNFASVSPDSGGNLTFYMGRLTGGEQKGYFNCASIRKH
jgi:hypothetical protein